MTRNDLVKVGVLAVMMTVVVQSLIGIGVGFWLYRNTDLVQVWLSRFVGTPEIVTRLDSELTTESKVVAAVKKANPAVVAITVSKDVPIYEQYLREVPSPFRDFFGDGFFNFSVPDVRQNGTEKRDIGGGSGFLVTNNGYIVTNRHVVDDEDASYTVLLSTGASYDAEVVARDSVLDIAVLKIAGEDFPYLAFGNSDTIEVGQSVIAIGNALAEFKNTVSVGIVSGLARSIVASDGRGEREALDQLIQTDAAINQGNSGGPLLNLAGEVIGVNVAVASGAENIGFALGANSVKYVVESVEREGRIVRPYLGVRYLPVTPEVKAANNLAIDYGVLVRGGDTVDTAAVVPKSPAAEAGIVAGDVIVAFGGVKITADINLANEVRKYQVGATVDVTIWRDGTERVLKVTLQEMPQ